MGLTQAPAPLKLVDKQGKEHCFSLHPLQDIDISEMTRWLQAQSIARARESCVGVSEEERRYTMTIAIETSQNISFLSETGLRAMATVEGIVKMIQIMAKGQVVDLAVLSQCLLLEENKERFNDTFELLEASKSNGRVVGKKRKAKRKPRKKRS